MLNRSSNYISRIRTTALRYIYFIEALLKYKVFQKGAVSHEFYGDKNQYKLISISPPKPTSSKGIYVIHLHGMGDSVWSAFKDGVNVYPEVFNATLIIPQLQNSSWCSENTINNLLLVLNDIRLKSPNSKIVLSGTSMGGSIAINSLRKKEVTGYIAAVITCSASTQLNKLLRTTNSDKVKNALIASTGHAENPEEILRRQSLHNTASSINIPVAIIYSPFDKTIPPDHTVETINKLSAQGTAIKFIKMDRPNGHFRPTKNELLSGYSWVKDQIN